MGHMGYTEDQFWDMTPRAFWNAFDKYNERETLNEQNEWERNRWAVWWNVNMQLSKGNKIELRDVVVFPWEEESKIIELPTEEDIRKIIERDKNLF